MKKKWFNILLLSILSVTLVSCSCSRPKKVRTIQREDKQLTCKDVILEINETEYLRKQALESKGISPSQALLPLCWAPTYMAAQDAVKAADERLEYLSQIYDLLHCGQKQRAPQRSLPAPPPIRPGALPSMQRSVTTPPPPGNLPPRYNPPQPNSN